MSVMTILYFICLALFLFLSLLLCGVILLQESKNSGLGASFGGDVSSSLFGTSTADVLKKFTAWLAFIFLFSCILLSLWTNAMGRPQTNSPDFTMEHIES